MLGNIMESYYCKFKGPLSCEKCCLEIDGVCGTEQNNVEYTPNFVRIHGKQEKEKEEMTNNENKHIEMTVNDGSVPKNNYSRSENKLGKCCKAYVGHMLTAMIAYLKIEMCGHEIGCTGWKENFVTPF